MMRAITIDSLNPETLAKLEARARQSGKSVDEEAAAVLETVVGQGKMDGSQRLAFADAIAAMTPKGVVQTDSTLLIREDRDR